MVRKKTPNYYLISSYYYSDKFVAQAHTKDEAKEKAYLGLIYPRRQHPNSARSRGIYKPEFWRATAAEIISLERATKLVPELKARLLHAHPPA